MTDKPILFVTSVDPWTQTHGALLRQRWILRVLAEFAPVHMVFLDPFDWTVEAHVVEEHERLEGVHKLVHASGVRSTLRAGDRIAWLRSGAVPLELVRSLPPGWLESLRNVLGDQEYGLCWYSRSRSFAAVSPAVSARASVIDIDDVESSKRRQHVLARFPKGEDLTTRDRLARWQAVRDARSWEAFERRAAESVDMALVCHEADAAALGIANVRVLPNTYPRPRVPLGRSEIGEPPTILMQGSLTYAPNVDGAQYLVHEVLPRLRRTFPDVRLRLVGRAGDAARRLHDPPRVVVTGYVDAIEDELQRADIITVPIRFGGGSRIKIIEALAHRIPVVSTTAGAAGLDVEAEQHLLLADSAESFASAIDRALRDRITRSRLREQGALYFQERLTTEAGVRRLRGFVGALLERLDGPK